MEAVGTALKGVWSQLTPRVFAAYLKFAVTAAATDKGLWHSTAASQWLMHAFVPM